MLLIIMDNGRQITFRIDPKLWKSFGIKCIEKDISKTKALTEFIKKFCK